MTANYHTHTRWSRHGSGEIEDYVKAALDVGFTEIAITEHMPIPGDPDHNRMSCGDFEPFNAELDEVVEAYRGRIRVIKGLECEYYPQMEARYRQFRREYGYTLLALAQHTSFDRRVDNFLITSPAQLAQYARQVCQALESGHFNYLAHPDIPLHTYPRVDEHVTRAMEEIFDACRRLGIPAEINANGYNGGRGYPDETVWTAIAPRFPGLKVLVGSDAHHVKNLLGPHVAACEAMAREAGLDLLETLPLPASKTAKAAKKKARPQVSAE